MLFYLTNTVLDIIWGSTFWILKKTTSGVYYLVWGDDTPRLENGENDAIIITKEDIENDEKIQELLTNTTNQAEQIKLLTSKNDGIWYDITSSAVDGNVINRQIQKNIEICKSYNFEEGSKEFNQCILKLIELELPKILLMNEN